MGGRTAAPKTNDRPDNYAWIQDVPDHRLEGYRRMLATSQRHHRTDGSKRREDFFDDLVTSETARRKGTTPKAELDRLEGDRATQRQMERRQNPQLDQALQQFEERLRRQEERRSTR